MKKIFMYNIDQNENFDLKRTDFTRNQRRKER